MRWLNEENMRLRIGWYPAVEEALTKDWPFTELEFRFGKLYTLSRTGNWRVRK